MIRIDLNDKGASSSNFETSHDQGLFNNLTFKNGNGSNPFIEVQTMRSVTQHGSLTYSRSSDLPSALLVPTRDTIDSATNQLPSQSNAEWVVEMVQARQ